MLFIFYFFIDIKSWTLFIIYVIRNIWKSSASCKIRLSLLQCDFPKQLLQFGEYFRFLKYEVKGTLQCDFTCESWIHVLIQCWMCDETNQVTYGTSDCKAEAKSKKFKVPSLSESSSEKALHMLFSSKDGTYCLVTDRNNSLEIRVSSEDPKTIQWLLNIKK